MSGKRSSDSFAENQVRSAPHEPWIPKRSDAKLISPASARNVFQPPPPSSAPGTKPPSTAGGEVVVGRSREKNKKNKKKTTSWLQPWMKISRHKGRAPSSFAPSRAHPLLLVLGLSFVFFCLFHLASQHFSLPLSSLICRTN